MKKLLCALLLSVGLYSPCRAAEFDFAVPAGLTVGTLGASSFSGWPGWEQGYAIVAFSDPVNAPWWANCAGQRLYINMLTTGGKAMYQTILMAKIMGKKVVRFVGNTSDPSIAGSCSLIWVQVEP